MKYTKEERLKIGGEIYNNELTKYEASEKYGISIDTARNYMRLYRDANNLQEKEQVKLIGVSRILESASLPELEEYESMTKEQLIRELIKARINEARLKKGYEVQGDGAQKVFLPLENRNTK